MARYTGPKDKLSRREGFDLFNKGAKLTRLAVPPGQHGPKRVTKLSQYGQQLREKQKVKRLYGVLERQFKRYIEQATRTKGKTGEALIRVLELRLDNVVYRLGFSSNRPTSRQLVVHGHVFVNGRRMTIPSYQVKIGDVITLTPKGQKIPQIIPLLSEQPGKTIGSWLERKAVIGTVKRLPEREDISEPIDEQSIIEFYSR